MSPDVLVLGGGTAGLAAATALASEGARVRVLEARATCGGRARSWLDPEIGHVEDNGQHLVLGCYDAFLAFARRIGSEERIRFQERLELTLAEPGGGMVHLRLPGLPSPLDLLVGAVRMDGLPLAQVAGAAGLALDASRGGPARGERTVAEWLASHGQGREARRLLWDPIVLATLNLDPARACASLLAPVVTRALLAGPKASRIGMIDEGLSSLIADPAVRYLLARNGEVRASSPVVGLELAPGGGRVQAAVTRDGVRHGAGAFVVAAPPVSSARILPPGASPFGPAEAATLGASPIVAVHIWLDRLVMDRPMVGFLDSPVHWAFDRGARAGGPGAGYVALITSAADAWAKMSSERVASLAVVELRRYLPAAAGATVRRIRVVKERSATPVFDRGAVRLRPGTRTAVPNLFLAGDWVDTGLPATLEAAAESGHRAARAAAGEALLESRPRA